MRLGTWAAARRPWQPGVAAALALLGLVLATGLVITSTLPRPMVAPVVEARDALTALPVSFEPVGDGSFVSRGPGYSLRLTTAGADLRVGDGAFRLRPAAGATGGALVGAGPTGTTVTRLAGDQVFQGRSYARVEAPQVWPGVDMVWHGDRRRLEHDFVVAPGQTCGASTRA